MYLNILTLSRFSELLTSRVKNGIFLSYTQTHTHTHTRIHTYTQEHMYEFSGVAASPLSRVPKLLRRLMIHVTRRNSLAK